MCKLFWFLWTITTLTTSNIMFERAWSLYILTLWRETHFERLRKYHTFVYVRACVLVPSCLGMCMHVHACSLSYPACNEYAPYCDVICGPSGSTTFFDIISYKARFSEKVTEQKMCVWFSLQLLSKTILF